MSYIGNETIDGSKHSEEKRMSLMKRPSSSELELELTTRSEDFKSTYKMILQQNNLLVIKRLIDVSLFLGSSASLTCWAGTT